MTRFSLAPRDDDEIEEMTERLEELDAMAQALQEARELLEPYRPEPIKKGTIQ
jgi:hypothetical protein